MLDHPILNDSSSSRKPEGLESLWISLRYGSCGKARMHLNGPKREGAEESHRDDPIGWKPDRTEQHRRRRLSTVPHDEMDDTQDRAD